MSHELSMANSRLVTNIGVGLYEFKRARELEDRRLYLYGIIESADLEDKEFCYDASITSKIVEHIFDFNRQDKGIPVEERRPIRLYINSPGGNVSEGFALASAIELSKTPIYTINIGQWSSMAFLIGICGHKRFSLPDMTFLMHDGSTAMFGSANKVQDRIDFEKRFDQEVVRRHVLKHSKMDPVDYDALARVELYLLPEDALKRGFIDEIVTDLDTIL